MFLLDCSRETSEYLDTYLLNFYLLKAKFFEPASWILVIKRFREDNAKFFNALKATKKPIKTH